uniref:Protein kinase domain-containing protein n=1 Tax=Arcella intermedia TaxID=1963864 RepID=A0A6B2LD71_9EUKA
MQGYHGTYEIQLGKFLGKGAGGQVNLGRNIQSNESVAVKLMTKDYIDTERGAAKIRELQMLHTMTHPYIISVIESIEIPDAFYIIMELGRGDLMHKLEEGIHDTAQAKRVAMNLFSALEYLHSIGICHRDVKPENLLCCQGPRGEEAWKLGDFGIAIFFTEEDPYITGNIGTPDYMAPEIFLDQKYTKEVDLWAAGVTLFSALTAQSPWAHTNPQAKQHAILIGEVSWHQETWDAIDPNAKDLVEKLIVRDPQERPSPEACLRHKWLIV